MQACGNLHPERLRTINFACASHTLNDIFCAPQIAEPNGRQRISAGAEGSRKRERSRTRSTPSIDHVQAISKPFHQRTTQRFQVKLVLSSCLASNVDVEEEKLSDVDKVQEKWMARSDSRHPIFTKGVKRLGKRERLRIRSIRSIDHAQLVIKAFH